MDNILKKFLIGLLLIIISILLLYMYEDKMKINKLYESSINIVKDENNSENIIIDTDEFFVYKNAIFNNFKECENQQLYSYKVILGNSYKISTEWRENECFLEVYYDNNLNCISYDVRKTENIGFPSVEKH